VVPEKFSEASVLFFFLVSAVSWILMSRVRFLGFLHLDFDVTTLVSWFLADTGSGGERNRVEMVPLPQPLPMAGMDANLTDNSGQIDSFGRSKFVCSSHFQFLSWLTVRFLVSNSFLGFQFVSWPDHV
jgi:hypothetical protein